MTSLLSLFRNRYFVVGSGFVLLISLAFTLGAWLGWSMTTRLYVVIGILALSVLAVVVELLRSQRSASKMEESMRWQAEHQAETSRPDKKREIEEMQQRFETAVQKLKRSNLGRGRRGSAALHALPWYLFIGPPSSGKTTAIVNSGLNFPVGTDRVRGVGGTRNCDWFFSDQAIILDTAGRYVTDTDDEKEWHTFLDMLRENRPGRPINGVVVAISVADLLDADAYDVEWHATTIRRRVSELVEHLGVRFPVYLVFTKCDLVQGFVEFFRDLTQREREQVWGCTFDDATGDATGDRGIAPRAQFEQAFERLNAALSDIRLARMRRSMKRETRRRVYVFPVEFAAMKDALADFVGHLFQPNPYDTEPELRGFYFTSGTQEGSPIDRVIRNVADHFELPSLADSSAAPALETKSFFLKDLFTRVVIPDQYRVRPTAPTARSGRWKRAGLVSASAVALGLFVLGASQAFVRSALDVRRVHTASVAAAPVEWTRAADAASLAPLADLLDEVHRLSDPENPPSFRWGLARHETVVDPAKRLHYTRLLPLVDRHVQALERRLDATGRLPAGLAGEDSLRRDTYADLRAYLLLTTDHVRLADSTEQRFLHRHLVHLGAPGRWNDAQRAAQYDAQVAAFVQGFARDDRSPFAADTRRIDQVRRRLLDFAALSPYDRLRAEGITTLRDVALMEMVPREHAALFASNPELPGLFTTSGWTSFVQPRIEAERRAPGQGDWVLGEAASTYRTTPDGDAIAAQIERDYAADYVTEWRRFLSQVRLRDTGRLDQSARDLQALGHAQSSPLLYFLAYVAEQTDYAPLAAASDASPRAAVAGAVAATTGRGGAADTTAAPHPITEQFAWLHALRPREAVSNPSPALAQALDALHSTGRALDGLTADPQRAADVVAAVLAENGGNLGAGLQAIDDGLYRFDSALRRQLFEAPIRSAWRQVVGVAQAHLDARWREAVSRPFDAQLGRLYPFDASATMDAALIDVETFFAPGSGTLDAFVDGELRPFFDPDRQRPRTWDGVGIALSPATTRFLDDADRLQATLFDGGVVRLAFEMRAELPERSGDAPRLSQTRIALHGTADVYTMGQPYWFDVVWPGRPGASLSVTGRDAVIPEKRFEGDWALFRLLQDARVRPTSRTEGRALWTFEEPGRYRIGVQYDVRLRRGTELFVNPTGFFRLTAPATLN